MEGRWEGSLAGYLFLLVESDGVPVLLLIRHADGDAGPAVLQSGPWVMLQAAGGGGKPPSHPKGQYLRIHRRRCRRPPPSKARGDAVGTRAPLTCPRPAPPSARGW